MLVLVSTKQNKKCIKFRIVPETMIMWCNCFQIYPRRKQTNIHNKIKPTVATLKTDFLTKITHLCMHLSILHLNTM